MTSLLDRLAELQANATPGPWRARNLGRHDSSAIVREGEAAALGNTFGGHGAADAAVIVAAVNALPALLRIARAAEALTKPPCGQMRKGEFLALRDAVQALGVSGHE